MIGAPSPHPISHKKPVSICTNEIWFCADQNLKLQIGFAQKLALILLKKSLLDPNFFHRAIQSAHPVEKTRLFRRDARIGLLNLFFFFSPFHLTTPQNIRSHRTAAYKQLQCWLCWGEEFRLPILIMFSSIGRSL